MRDLDGMDYYLTTFHSKKLGSLERALLSALQSGAFISASEHARYDAPKQSLCNLCQCEDDRAHWLCCPRFKHLREAIMGWHPDNIELPSCVVHHLLIPRLPAVVSWRKTLQQIQDSSKVFLFYPKAKDKHHLFMDGACTQPAHQCRLASWGIVSATTGDVVAPVRSWQRWSPPCSGPLRRTYALGVTPCQTSTLRSTFKTMVWFLPMWRTMTFGCSFMKRSNYEKVAALSFAGFHHMSMTDKRATRLSLGCSSGTT